MPRFEVLSRQHPTDLVEEYPALVVGEQANAGRPRDEACGVTRRDTELHCHSLASARSDIRWYVEKTVIEDIGDLFPSRCWPVLSDRLQTSTQVIYACIAGALLDI